MKKMRMWLLAGLLLCGVGTSFAQSRDMVRFGIGLDMTANRITNYYSNETCGRIGFNVGLKVDVNFTDNMYLGTGFQYAQKGAKKSGPKGSQKERGRRHLQVQSRLPHHPRSRRLPL